MIDTEKVIRVSIFNGASQVIFEKYWESNSDNILFMQNFEEFLKKNGGEFEIEIDHYVKEQTKVDVDKFGGTNGRKDFTDRLPEGKRQDLLNRMSRDKYFGEAMGE